MLALAEELDLQVELERGRHHVLGQINNKLVEIKKSGKQVVFLLDEAQAMPEDSIEALRLLTNLETESEKLLQVVLFGQPELDDMLSKESLRQRITFSYVLPVLNQEEVHSYINHRLTKSGFPGVNLFSPRAIQELGKASKGIPRLINILCHKALLVAFGRGDTKINHLHVRRAIEDTEDVHIEENFSAPRKNATSWLALAGVGVLVSTLTLLAVYLLGNL